MNGEALARLYSGRFSPHERDAQERLWAVLVRHRLQRYVDEQDTVLDYGAGGCGFINHIRAHARLAIDLSPRVGDAAAPGVHVIVGATDALGDLADASVDVVFSSNVLEHLETRDELLSLLGVFRRVVRPTGRIVLIGPNYRFAYREYWDFIDHKLPLSDRSISEALQLSGFKPVEIEDRFLPFTTKGKPSSPRLLQLFLSLPTIIRRPFCGQFLVVAEPDPDH